MPNSPTIPLFKAYTLMATAKSMAELYEREKDTTSKYVHATSRGHEAAQLALALQLEAKDYVAPYYRDDSILLGIGMTPKDLMLQLLAKIDDPFSGGRTYYSHPSLKDDDKPKILIRARQPECKPFQLLALLWVYNTESIKAWFLKKKKVQLLCAALATVR